MKPSASRIRSAVGTSRTIDGAHHRGGVHANAGEAALKTEIAAVILEEDVSSLIQDHFRVSDRRLGLEGLSAAACTKTKIPSGLRQTRAAVVQQVNHTAPQFHAQAARCGCGETTPLSTGV